MGQHAQSSNTTIKGQQYNDLLFDNQQCNTILRARIPDCFIPDLSR